MPWHTSVLASCWLLLWQAGKTMKRLGHIALYSLFQGVYTNINWHLPGCLFWLARLICTLSDKVAPQLSIILSIPFPFSPSSRLEDRVNKVLRSLPASLPWHEKDVRLLHRFTFLIPSRTDQEYSYWMTQILKPWPITFQARLLYLLTGPEDANGERADHQLVFPSLLVVFVVHHTRLFFSLAESWGQ